MEEKTAVWIKENGREITITDDDANTKVAEILKWKRKKDSKIGKPGTKSEPLLEVSKKESKEE